MSRHTPSWLQEIRDYWTRLAGESQEIRDGGPLNLGMEIPLEHDLGSGERTVRTERCEQERSYAVYLTGCR